MRAVVVEEYGGPERLLLRDIPKPSTAPGTVLLRMFAAGVNPVDTYQRSGAQGYTPALPFTPGMDGAGIIEEIGTGVTGLQTGMRVYTTGSVTGTYAEYCLCSPDHLWPLPEDLEWSEGASLGVPYFTAARALFTRGQLSGGEILLVHGATGGVGLACLQLTRGMDVTVFATAGSAEGEALARNHGADMCFNHRDARRFEAIREAAGEKGVGLIVEMLANVNLDSDLKLLGGGGRVVIVGSRGRIEIAPRDLMSVEGSVLGMKMPFSSPAEKQEYARIIAEGITSGRVRPPVHAVYPMESAGEAHQEVIAGPHRGNLVIGIL